MLRQRLASNLTADKEAEIAICRGSYEKLSRKLRAQKSCCFVVISVPASVANPRQGPSCIYRRCANSLNLDRISCSNFATFTQRDIRQLLQTHRQPVHSHRQLTDTKGKQIEQVQRNSVKTERLRDTSCIQYAQCPNC